MYNSIGCFSFLQRIQTAQGSWFVCYRSWRVLRWQASRFMCGRNGRSPNCLAVHITLPLNKILTWQCPWRIIACQPNGRHRSPNRRRYRHNSMVPCQNCSIKPPIMRRLQSNGIATVWLTGTWEPITKTWSRRSFSDMSVSPFHSKICYHFHPLAPLLLFFPTPRYN